MCKHNTIRYISKATDSKEPVTPKEHGCKSLYKLS